MPSQKPSESRNRYLFADNIARGVAPTGSSQLLSRQQLLTEMFMDAGKQLFSVKSSKISQWSSQTGANRFVLCVKMQKLVVFCVSVCKQCLRCSKNRTMHERARGKKNVPNLPSPWKRGKQRFENKGSRYLCLDSGSQSCRDVFNTVPSAEKSRFPCRFHF